MIVERAGDQAVELNNWLTTLEASLTTAAQAEPRTMSAPGLISAFSEAMTFWPRSWPSVR